MPHHNDRKASFPTTFGLIQSVAWRVVKRWVRRSFPTVEGVSTSELANELSNNKPSPILIDVRKPEEYRISHLPKALNLSTLAAIEQQKISSETSIVVYCSIGYRSGRLAQQLQLAGYTVKNLEGSIFQWANEGRSLVTTQNGAEAATNEVHPYNQVWGMLLKRNP
ncbi:MAG: rhodanese-like domain-containing protein [Phormidesmis sp.]